MITLFGATLLLVILIFVVNRIMVAGARKSQNKNYKETLDAVNKANDARRDKSKLNRVRNKYTKP